MIADPWDVSIAAGATGLLRDFNVTGVVSAADVHVATTLADRMGEDDEDVRLAVALTVRALREGSVLLDLTTARDAVAVLSAPRDGDAGGDDEARSAEGAIAGLAWPEPSRWLSACRRSPLVGHDGDPAAKPLRLVGTGLYLDRYFQEEAFVRETLAQRAAGPQPSVDEAALRISLARMFEPQSPDHHDLQRLAVAAAVLGGTTIVAGGPGTGKTTTVAKLLAALYAVAGPALQVALAAPTGKAAARLTQAVAGAYEGARAESAPATAPAATTLHRLLGTVPGVATRFRHCAGNRLPYDVVIVDESSMLSLTMAARLLEALRPDARLVLVGDPDQLVSVEAGSVLADLVGRAPRSDDVRVAATHRVSRDEMAGSDTVSAASLDEDLRRDLVRLRRAYRFTPQIAALARAVNEGRDDEVVATLRDRSDSVRWVEADAADLLRGASSAGARLLTNRLAGWGRRLLTAIDSGVDTDILAALEAHRLLCAHRQGAYGVSRWSAWAQWVISEHVTGYGPVGVEPAYVGAPLLVTANDYATGLFNGDVGVVVNATSGPVGLFDAATGPIRVPVSRLGQVESMHAMTIHKSQGSETTSVSVVLPPPGSRLLTRELLYTAVTRARDSVLVVGPEESVRAAVRRPVVRASGLRGAVDELSVEST